MKRFLSYLLSYLILLQGCAGSRPLLMREIPRAQCGTSAEQAYREYAKKVRRPQNGYELLNLGLLAYEAGDWMKSATCLSSAEDFTHRGTPLFEKVMLHYYRGLSHLGQSNKLAAQREAERIVAHLTADTTFGGYPYARWCGNLLAEASDTSEAIGDSGRVIVVCETGLMPRLTTSKASVLVYSGDQYFPLSDSSRDSYGETLRKRWLTNEHPGWAPLGYVTADLPQYWAPPAYATVVQSVELVYDGVSYAYPALTANVAEAELDGLAERQAQMLAMAPVVSEVDYTTVPPESYDEEYVVTGRGERHHEEDRGQPEKREGRRQTPEPEKKKDTQKDTSKAKQKEDSEKEKKQEHKKEEKKDEDNIGTGWLVAGIALILVAGVFIGAYYGGKAVVNAAHPHRGEVEPSWEMLPVKIFATTLALPPGTHDARVLFKDGNGEIVMRHEFQPVAIEAGRTVVVRARCME